MGTGYRPEKFFWLPMGTEYRPNFQRCRFLAYTSSWMLMIIIRYGHVFNNYRRLKTNLSRFEQRKKFFASILNGDFITNLNVTHRAEILSDSWIMVQSRQVWRKVSKINIELKSNNYILANKITFSIFI